MRERDAGGRFISAAAAAKRSRARGMGRDARGRFVKRSAESGPFDVRTATDGAPEFDKALEQRAKSVEEFNAAMKAHTTNMKENMVRLFVQKVGMELLRRLVKITPRDTGYAQSGWQVSIGPGNAGQSASGSSSAAIADGFTRIMSWNPFSSPVITVFNNVPYVIYLDVGRVVGGRRTPPHSRQAPNGIILPVLNLMRRRYSPK